MSSAKSRLVARIIVLIGLGLWLGIGIAFAQEGVSYLDERDLSVVLDEESPVLDVPIRVVNSNSVTSTLTLLVEGLMTTDGVLAPPLWRVEPPTQEVPPGRVATFNLHLERQGEAATYAGQLILLTEDGNFVRRTLHVTTAPLVTPSGTPTLKPGALEKVFLAGVNWAPSLLAPYLSAVHVDMPSATQNYSGPRQRVGLISSSTGVIGQIVLEGDHLSVADLDRAGSYTGNIQLPGPDQTAIPVEINVRDLWIWPLAVLLVGLCIANLLANYAQVSRPRKRLELKVIQIREATQRTQDGQKEHQRDTTPWPFGQAGEVIALTDGQKGLVDQAGKKLLAGFDVAQSPEERKKWGPDGPEVSKVANYVDGLKAIYKILNEMATVYQTTAAFVDQHYSKVTFQDLPVAQKVRQAGNPRLITTSKGLEKTQTELNESHSFLKAFAATLAELDRLRVQAASTGKTSLVQEVEALQGRLLGAGVTDITHVQMINEEAQRLAQQIGSAPIPSHMNALARTMPLLQSLTPGGPQRYILSKEFRLDLTTLLSGPQVWPETTVEALSDKSSQQVQDELKRMERHFRLISGAIVLAAGMTALYLPNATFGSWNDYSGALLWGVTVDGAVKLARQIRLEGLGALVRGGV